MRNLPNKKGYAKHVKLLGDVIYAVEHYRGHRANTAIVILQDGQYFIGRSYTNPEDNYSRKLGHEIAVGRALDRAVNRLMIHQHEDCNDYNPDGYLWSGNEEKLTGRALGAACILALDGDNGTWYYSGSSQTEK